MKQINWDDIRNEYITTNISYRKLSEKYKVHLRTLAERAKAEKWVEQRVQKRDKTVTKTIEKTSDMAAARAANLMTATDMVLHAILEDIEKIKAAEVPYNWKNITGALKDIKDIQTVPENTQQNIRISFGDIDDEWSN